MTVHAPCRNHLHLKEPVYISLDKDILCQGDAITGWDQGNVSLDDLVKAQKAGLLNEKTNEAILKELARDAFILKEDTSMPPSGDGVSSLGR